MTHSNVLATVSAVMTIVPDLSSKDIYLAYLPMAHILELAAEVWTGESTLYQRHTIFHFFLFCLALFLSPARLNKQYCLN